MLIQKPQQLQELCDELRVANAPIALDTEFISEKRYFGRCARRRRHFARDFIGLEATHSTHAALHFLPAARPDSRLGKSQ
jgi:hypothetical protein